MSTPRRQHVLTGRRVRRLVLLTLALAVLSNYALMAIVTWTPSGPLKSLLPEFWNQTYRFGSLDLRMIDLHGSSMTIPNPGYARWQSTPLIDLINYTPPFPDHFMSSDMDVFVADITDSITLERPSDLPLDRLLDDVNRLVDSPRYQPRVAWIAVGWPMRSFHATTIEAFSDENGITRPAWPTFTHAWIEPAGRAQSETYTAPLTPLWPGFAINTAVYWLLWLILLGTLLYARPLWRQRHGRCIRCGYSLDDLASDRCPECGSVIDSASATVGAQHRALPAAANGEE